MTAPSENLRGDGSAYVDRHRDHFGRPFFSANAIYGDGGRQVGPFHSCGVALLTAALLAAEHGLVVAE